MAGISLRKRSYQFRDSLDLCKEAADTVFMRMAGFADRAYQRCGESLENAICELSSVMRKNLSQLDWDDQNILLQTIVEKRPLIQIAHSMSDDKNECIKIQNQLKMQAFRARKQMVRAIRRNLSLGPEYPFELP